VSILEGSATRAFLELASGADLAPSAASRFMDGSRVLAASDLAVVGRCRQALPVA
jgi:hypothetical protein